MQDLSICLSTQSNTVSHKHTHMYTHSVRQVLLNTDLAVTESPEGPTVHTTNNVMTEGGNFS